MDGRRGGGDVHRDNHRVPLDSEVMLAPHCEEHWQLTSRRTTKVQALDVHATANGVPTLDLLHVPR
jgi:hypothetical protein